LGLVERDRMGGTCLNRGCIPTKAMLETADLLHRVTEQGAEFGLAGSDGVSLDYPALGKRRDFVVEKHVKGVEFLMKKNGVTILRGTGHAHQPDQRPRQRRRIGRRRRDGTDLILATGSAPRHLPGLEVDGKLIITSDEALQREAVPKRVAIVGAGAIGVEWASLYRDLGAEVHLVEYLDRIVPLEDADVSKELTRIFKKRNVKIYVSSSIDPKSIEATKGGVHFAVEARDGKTRVEMETDVILVAVGRRPVTDEIGLDKIPGVEMERGFVKVDGFMQTGVPHLYAIGDIVPGYALAPRGRARGGGRGREDRRPRPGAGAHGPDAARHLLPARDRIGGDDRGPGDRCRATPSRSAPSPSARSARPPSWARSTASPSSWPMPRPASCSART
jgi:dihydrolipoamide dehydrogenase